MKKLWKAIRKVRDAGVRVAAAVPGKWQPVAQEIMANSKVGGHPWTKKKGLLMLGDMASSAYNAKHGGGSGGIFGSNDNGDGGWDERPSNGANDSIFDKMNKAASMIERFRHNYSSAGTDGFNNSYANAWTDQPNPNLQKYLPDASKLFDMMNMYYRSKK